MCLKNKLPSLATITLATVSGILVPAASKVSPMTVSGMPSVSPEQTQSQTRLQTYCRTTASNMLIGSQLTPLLAFVVHMTHPASA